MPDDVITFDRFAIYDFATGAIARIVICAADAISDQAGEGERWIECADLAINDLTHKVIGGEFVPR